MRPNELLDRAVELPIAAAMQAVAVGVARAGGDRGEVVVQATALEAAGGVYDEHEGDALLASVLLSRLQGSTLVVTGTQHRERTTG